MIVFFLGIFATMMFLWHMTGRVLGQEYDYLTRTRTYPGLKATFWLSVLIACYYIGI